MKNEIAMHQKNVASLESKINEEKSKGEKASSDAQLKYNSLQQHFNLLKVLDFSRAIYVLELN